MDDLISRQAAIDALAKAMPSLTTPDGCGEFDHDIQVTDEAYVDCMQIIHELPSVQPRTKCIAEIKISKEDLDELVAEKVEEIKAAQPKQRWIPCSEFLPEKDGDYLAWYEEGYREDYGIDEIGISPFEEDCGGFGVWQERYDPVSLGYLDSEWVEIKVLAWMPLPEPYTEGAK